ncbi:hypothetical protein QE364_002742 [Nocardioides zeae]|uniref:Uncharacterized protein n=1 Tax=Nocardioides zeae TaxID=1457234 RepID=A0ACC6IJW1_9ACTN|nr:hypothetical protein [Nocardioides zeae]MDR6211023.1 hypothetical protein [Nocardioides zeae]
MDAVLIAVLVAAPLGLAAFALRALARLVGAGAGGRA